MPPTCRQHVRSLRRRRRRSSEFSLGILRDYTCVSHRDDGILPQVYRNAPNVAIFSRDPGSEPWLHRRPPASHRRALSCTLPRSHAPFRSARLFPVAMFASSIALPPLDRPPLPRRYLRHLSTALSKPFALPCLDSHGFPFPCCYSISLASGDLRLCRVFLPCIIPLMRF